MPALDHVFVCCSAGGHEAAALARLGLAEGTSNTHPGQGTLSGSEPLSAAAEAVERAGLVAFSRGDDYLMTLAFDHGAAGGGADLRPDLPLRLEW